MLAIGASSSIITQPGPTYPRVASLRSTLMRSGKARPRRSIAPGTSLSHHRLASTLRSVEALEERVLLSTTIPLSTSTWTALGPGPILNGQIPGGGPVSGRLTGIAADPTDANTIYVASAGGGVWKTTNGGTSWAPLTDNQPTLAMGSIAIAPSNPSIIYA